MNRSGVLSPTRFAAVVPVALFATLNVTAGEARGTSDGARRALVLESGGTVEVRGPISRWDGLVVFRDADGTLASLQERQVRDEILLPKRPSDAIGESSRLGGSIGVIRNRDLPPARDLPRSRVIYTRSEPNTEATTRTESITARVTAGDVTRRLAPTPRAPWFVNSWNELRYLRGEITVDEVGGLNRIRVNRVNRVNRINRVNDLSPEGRRREKRLRELLVGMERSGD